MQISHLKHLHAPLIFAGLRGLADSLPLSLAINSPLQVVGQKPTYTIQGAPPGAKIFWSSYLNGKPTGEFNTDYGQTVESNGTALLTTADGWKDEHVGTWQKQILVQDAAGTNYRAMVQFQVSPAAASTPSAPTPSGSSVTAILGRPLFALGGFQVTVGIAAAAAGAWWLFSKRR